MTGRVNSYYQHPASPEFIHHMIEENGFCEQDKQIIRNLRECFGDTELHAQAAGLPIKVYNDRTASINKRMMDELFRLAEIGYKSEKRTR